jgi:molecular chaperone DnaK (HSP70)
VDASADGGLPTLTRTAVGEHLMLGGDNMDLALAHQLEPAFAAKAAQGQRLSAALCPAGAALPHGQGAVAGAERARADRHHLAGGGSKLLAATQSVTLTREQVRQSVVDGFLPVAQISDMPARRQGALRGFGLPYPADAAISRHLAQFLGQHASGGCPIPCCSTAACSMPMPWCSV